MFLLILLTGNILLNCDHSIVIAAMVVVVVVVVMMMMMMMMCYSTRWTQSK
jgi:hypothetical protein